jgi:hypothetical protein
MKLYLSSTFSINMLAKEGQAIKFYPIPLSEAKKLATISWITSAVGHQSTAEVYSRLLGVEVPCQRMDVRLGKKDALLIGSIKGGRLPEGAVLSEVDPSSIEWWVIQHVQPEDV